MQAVEEGGEIEVREKDDASPVTEADPFVGSVTVPQDWLRDGLRVCLEAGEMAHEPAPDDGHIITVAPTGAGKGRSAIIPNLLRYQGPVIVVDPKGENCRVTARARRAMGHDVRIIDPFGLVTDKTDQLNPLDVLGRPGVELESEAQALAMMLSRSPKRWRQPRTSWARAASATRRGGSPARRLPLWSGPPRESSVRFGSRAALGTAGIFWR